MAFLKKLPYYLKYYVRYLVACALLLCLFKLVQWSMRFNVNYRDIIPGMEVFSYNEAKLSHIAPIYILVWDGYYLVIDKEGKQTFPNLQCRVNNCFFTEDKDLLDGDYTRFDAIFFSQDALYTTNDRPERRAKSQIYIFSTIESAYNTPACEIFNDNFFNWTFTYRLDSDIVWSYFVVRNVTQHKVAPSENVKWKTNLNPISPSIVKILRQKKKAAAWLVSHCKADSMRDDYITRLQENLFHYSLKIDVYGDCTQKKCDDDDCEEMLTKDYYFYMAFENSFSEDYVSEKVLHGYNNYVVPIVYGGANYSR